MPGLQNSGPPAELEHNINSDAHVVVYVDPGPHTAAAPAAPEQGGPLRPPELRQSTGHQASNARPAADAAAGQPAVFYDPRNEAPTDGELLMAHVEGTDPYAFTELTRRHGSRLWAVAVAILRNPQDADDALQEAMLRAFVHAKGFRGDSSVYVWLRTLTVNVSTTMVAKRTRLAARNTNQDVGFKADSTAQDATTAIELDELLRQALNQVPEEQRAAFVLVHLLDLPVEQVAELQMVRPKTVYTRIHRARLRLVELLDYRQVIELLRRIDG